MDGFLGFPKAGWLVHSQSNSLSIIFIVRQMLSLERKIKEGGKRKGVMKREKEEKRDKRKTTGIVARVKDPRQGR